jgi:hypothetical protein
MRKNPSLWGLAAVLVIAAGLASTLGTGSARAAATCTPTGLVRDTINLTAAQIGGNVTGSLDATGCNIGVYYAPGTTGSVSGATIFGANYYGVVADGAAVSVTGSTIHDIGNVPFDGTQHGVAVLLTSIHQDGSTTGTPATGTIKNNTVTQYQKGGITVNGPGSSATISGNAVTGLGPVLFIAQNGIQIGFGATGSISSNTVSGNEYTGANFASSGGVLVVGGPAYSSAFSTGISITKNTVTNNDVGVWLSNAEVDGTAPLTATNNAVVNNTISKTDGLTNLTGNTSTCGYQAGVADEGNHDNIVNNKVSGNGYLPSHNCGDGTTFVRAYDILGAIHVKPNK